MSPHPFGPYLVVTRGGGSTVARVGGCDRLTADTLGEIGPGLSGLTGSPDLQVDLRAVGLLGSEALTLFVGLNKGLRAAGGRLTLFNARPGVCKVLAIARLDTLFDVLPEPAPVAIPPAQRP